MHFPTREELRDRNTRKWTVHPDDVLPAWIAESDFATCEPVKDAIRDAVEKESFGYTPATSDLPDAVADFYEERYGWRPNPDWITYVPDVVRGMLLAAQYLTREGSAVIVPVPSYPPFLEIPKTAGREAVYVGAEGGLDLAKIEQAFADGAGSILISAPNNPMGYVYEADFLNQLVDLADRYDARLLMDEIHAPLVYDGKHVVAAGLSEKAARVCVTVTATSKAWNIAGLKCAQMIFSNEQDWNTWKTLTGVAKDGTSTLGIVGATACYREGVPFLDEEVDYLRANRDYLIEELPQRLPGIKVTKPAATYLLWLDFTDTPLAADPAGLLLKHGKVALNDGSFFGPGGVGHARLNFATSREILEEVVERMEKAYKAVS